MSVEVKDKFITAESLKFVYDNKQNILTDADKQAIADLHTDPIIDSSLSDTSTNAVQNKVINEALGNKADASDVYTKSEIDAKITSAVHYKGTVESYGNLPIEREIGDMYNVQNKDDDNGIKAGDNVVWSGTTWDVQSGIVNLSGKQDKLTAGTGILISDDGTISVSFAYGDEVKY